MDWANLNEYVLLEVFFLLELVDLSRACCTCTRWAWVGRSEALWRRRFKRKYSQFDASLSPPPGSSSWRSEFRRLHWLLPAVPSEELRHHEQEVTHADISSDGALLATCGNDCCVLVYRTASPRDPVFHADLSFLGWRSADRCYFSPSVSSSSSLLMVSGTKAADIMAAVRGEIVVFSVSDDFQICARIDTKPSEASGCWFNTGYLLSCEHKWLSVRAGAATSVSEVLINRILTSGGGVSGGDSRTDHTIACVRSLARIYNARNSAVRHLMVLDAPRDKNHPGEDNSDAKLARELAARESRAIWKVEVPPSSDVPELPPGVDDTYVSLMRDGRYELSDLAGEQQSGDDDVGKRQKKRRFEYGMSYYESRAEAFRRGEDGRIWVFEDEGETADSSVECDDDDDDCSGAIEWEYFDETAAAEAERARAQLVKVDDGFEVINEGEKVLVFTAGEEGAVPHQVGIKKVAKVRFRKHMDFSLGLKEREERRRRQREDQREEENDATDWSDYPSVSHLFDPVDVVFDFRGRVVGMAASPCSKFLYVAYRPWPPGRFPSPASPPPPISTRVDCAVVDLVDLEIVGRLCGVDSGGGGCHVPGFLSNRSCPATVPSVTWEYVAICDEAGVASLYDRHFGFSVATLTHSLGSLVNYACLSPTGDLAVTVADDCTVTLWRSRAALRRRRSTKEEGGKNLS